MEMMYSAGIQIHYGLILALMGIIGFNAAMLQFAVNPAAYVRRARIAMPLSVMLIAAVTFTGIVMMAAKRLDFSFQNSAMILLTLLLIVLESRRYKALRRINPAQENVLTPYEPYAFKLLLTELAFVLVMTYWMSL